MPADWEQHLAIPLTGSKEDAENVLAPVIVYYNIKDGTMQASDPRPPPEDSEPLPAGWRKGYDIDGVCMRELLYLCFDYDRTL